MGRDVCFFDGQCGLCRRTATCLRRLDWLGLLDFRDMTGLQPGEIPVPTEVALRGMPLRTADGRVLVGFPAVRRAIARTPLGLLLAAALYLPGLSHAARHLYDRIALARTRCPCIRSPDR